MIEPTSTYCGHSFCKKCLSDSYIEARKCPVCRFNTINRLDFKNNSLKNLIKRFISKEQNNIKKEYKERDKQNEEWLLEKRSFNASEGGFIDVLDTENIWCEAEIKGIYKNRNHADTYHIHYIGWQTRYDEYICSNSERLAPYGMYTKKPGKLKRNPKLQATRDRRK